MDVKQLFLLRHAKSSWDDPDLADHDRPLSTRGYRDAALVRGYLERAQLVADLVLCSSSKRTQETLENLVPAFGTQTEVSVEPGLYGATADELLVRLNNVADTVQSVMLIGHNPGIAQLAVSLPRPGEATERVREKFPTAALATLEFGGGWRNLRPQGAQLTGFVRPKQLRASAD